MTKYEQLRDSLICGRNDEIDNAAFAVVNSVAKGEDDPVVAAYVAALIVALVPEGTEVNIDGKNRDEAGLNLDILMKELKDLVASHGIKKPEDGSDADWDMEVIGDITMHLEAAFSEKGLPLCHPFFDQDEDISSEDPDYDEENDGILCCLSCDRCGWCPKPDKNPDKE